MKDLKHIALLLLLLSVLMAGCVEPAETFSYRMAPSPENADDSFYIPPSSDAVLANTAEGEVRNVIFCIGDGMGPYHVALARHHGVGDDKKLYMEQLPAQGQVTTYSANNPVTDSAASGTAMACGVKTDNGMIGVAPDGTPYSSILEVLQKKGWRTGLVATSQISHATPASFASHVDSRNKQKDIAVQLVDNRVDVMFGGGRKFWSDDLLAKAVDDGYQMIETRDELAQIKSGSVIGLFGDDGLTTFAPEPTLSEMSGTAIAVLNAPGKESVSKKPNFFLMIEGSQIDWAAHANDTERTIRQTLLFDMAVREAVRFAQSDRHTLVIVTADHETGGLKLEQNNDNGVEAKWTSKKHTAANVPIYAFGPGSEKFSGTLDNIDISKRIAELTGIKEFPVVREPAEIVEMVTK